MRRSWYAWLPAGLLAWTCSAWAAPQQVGGGEGYTCALGESGRAFCWGSNSSGQIGNGAGMASTPAEFRPTEMAGGFVTVSSGGLHSCGLEADGSAFCWGVNYWGQLGTGATNNHGVSLPVRVQSPVPFQAISAGGAHTCALDTNGRAWCWGRNFESQLGNDPRLMVSSATPIRVLSNVPGVVQTFKSISAGGEHTCAIDMNDEAWCWGSNVGARAGIDIRLCGGSVNPPCNFFVPVKTIASEPPSSLRFRSLSAGDLNTCGIDTSGNVQCWGWLFRGQPPPLGRPVSPDNPAQVANVVNAVSVSVGGSSVCAVAGDGGLFCWGKDDQGQLGDGRTPMSGAESVTPVRVSGIQDYLSVSVGSAHACARAANDVLRCWGSNDNGELGLPLVGTSAAPKVVSGLQSSQIAAGGSHTCSLDAVGVTACWGSNVWGQVGHGRAGTVPPQSVVPTPVPRFFLASALRPTRPLPQRSPPGQFSSTIPVGKRGVSVQGTASLSRLAVGGQHVCVLDASGVAYCWGADGLGQVGNGNRTTAACRFGPASSKTCVPAPTIVSRAAGDGFADIAAGVSHTCARDRNGFVSCWGSSLSGELGSPVTCGQQPCFRRVPTGIQVPFGFRPWIVDVAGGDSSTCAVNEAADVFCWGDIARSPIPALMRYPTGRAYVRIGTGSGFACAGLLNGAAQCFGDNASGQLGDRSNTTSPTPTLVYTNMFSTFTVSRSFACGVDIGDTGTVSCWGANALGQLGDGTTNSSNVPVQVSLDAGFDAARVGVGFAHACAISTRGDIRCWGSNANGELGNGRVVNGPQTAPVAVAGGWRIP